MLSNIANTLLNSCPIFEQHCQLCGQRPSPQGLCSACCDVLPPLPEPCCPICACRSPSPLSPCGHCLRHRPAFDVLYAAYRYDYPLAGLIGNCKYGGQAALQGVLARLMTSIAARHPQAREIDLIVPVPLSQERLAERGFNLPDALARTVAATIGAPFDQRLCVRKRNTAQQAALNREERLRNVRDAFSVKRRCDGLCIAIVDDVATTGATLDALAKTLKKAGAKRVETWVLSRAIDHKI